MARVIATPEARADLVEIRLYSNQEFGPNVADTYFRGFKKAFRLLSQVPHAGPATPQYGDDIRCFTHRKHRIFYKIDGRNVLIVRIIHHARDAKRALI